MINEISKESSNLTYKISQCNCNILEQNKKLSELSDKIFKLSSNSFDLINKSNVTPKSPNLNTLNKFINILPNIEKTIVFNLYDVIVVYQLSGFIILNYKESEENKNIIFNINPNNNKECIISETNNNSSQKHTTSIPEIITKHTLIFGNDPDRIKLFLNNTFVKSLIITIPATIKIKSTDPIYITKF